jgi:hypothetical protein
LRSNIQTVAFAWFLNGPFSRSVISVMQIVVSFDDFYLAVFTGVRSNFAYFPNGI